MLWESFRGGTPSIAELIEEGGPPCSQKYWCLTEIKIT